MVRNSSTFNFRLIKFFICIALILLFVIAFVKIGDEYRRASEKNIINAWNKQRFEDFYHAEKDSIDLFFLGSSHSYCSFDPLIFDEGLGLNSFQIGMPLQHPDSTYYTLQEVLNYQSPKTVVMEIYWDMLDDAFEPKQVDALFQVLDNEALKNDFLKAVFPISEKLKYKLPLIRFQGDYFAYANSELKKYMEAKFNVKKASVENKGIEKYSPKGFIYCDYNLLADEYDKTNQFNGLDGKRWTFEASQKLYLTKIIELCKTENIKLVFVTAPIANVSMEKIKNYSSIHEAVAKFADSNDITYLDFNVVNSQEKLFTNENFRDDAHLNYSGAKIASEYLVRFLSQIIE